MAINDATGNISHGNVNIAELITNTRNSVNEIVGSVKFKVGSKKFKATDFVGMDAQNVPAFHNAIDAYRDRIQAIIDGFNAEPVTDVALKGDVATAVLDYLNAIKMLLDKYIAAIDVEKKEIDEAQANWQASAGAIAGDVTSDSDSIRSQANGISLE